MSGALGKSVSKLLHDKMRIQIAILLIISLTGCGDHPPKSVELVFEGSDMSITSLEDIWVDVEGQKFFGTWSKLDAFPGPLEDMPEDYRGPHREFTQIIFSPENNFTPSLIIGAHPIEGTTKVKVEFRSNVKKEDGDSYPDPKSIYLFTPKNRRLVRIGTFDRSDEEEDVTEKARAALRNHFAK